MALRDFYGLVLAGGQSTRMKTSKARLKYHGKPQAQVAAGLLTPLCQKVFISTRKGQMKVSGFELMNDLARYQGIGPLGGILSAMSRYPKASWLVLACDLPFVKPATLKHLLRYRDSKKLATAYRSPFNGLPEPLCAVYEPKAQRRLKQFFKKGVFCPRKILIHSQIRLLNLKDKHALDNVNTPEEYKNALKRIRRCAN